MPVIAIYLTLVYLLRQIVHQLNTLMQESVLITIGKRAWLRHHRNYTTRSSFHWASSQSTPFSKSNREEQPFV